MSWGIKILCLYLGFVALIVTLVLLTLGQNVDLVSEEYYREELEYQQKINTIERTAALGEQLTWKISGDTLLLDFPVSGNRNVSGSIFFFRPSDAQLDRKIQLQAKNDSLRRVPLTGLRKGVYRMQIDWKTGGTTYYNESIIQIP